MTANQLPRTYYITANTQYRPGSPNGYGFLRYSNSSQTDLPPTPTPQPGAVVPWNDTIINNVSLLASNINLPAVPTLTEI